MESAESSSPSSRGEVWIVKRELYLSDYAPALRALGFTPRLVEREETQKAGLPGCGRPLFILDTNIGAPTFRIVNARGIPFAGLILDQWYFSPRQKFTVDQAVLRAKLHLSPMVSVLDWHFSPDSPVFERGPPALAPEALFLFPCGPEQAVPLRERGLPHVEPIPFGVDAERFRPMELSRKDQKRFSAPVCFIGTPLVNDGNDGYRALAKGVALTRQKLPPDQVPVADRLKALLDELVARQVEDLFRYRLPEIVPVLEEKYRVRFFFPPAMESERETLMIQVGVHLSMLQRVSVARRLAPLGLAVYGPLEWKTLGIPDLDYRGEAPWAMDLPKAISGAAINVNVSKIMFETGVGPRLFEVLACGGFLLSNRNAGISELFEDGQDLVFYENLDDLEEKVRYYLAHPEERRRIGEHGRRTVVEKHTLLHRAQRIVQVLEEAGAIPPAAAAPAGLTD